MMVSFSFRAHGAKLYGLYAILIITTTENHETPETPAPLFAARALKSAIFGTPGFRDEDEQERPQQAVDVNSRFRPGAQAPGESSPIKPQGILLTPGTATVRRKTVSFGAGVVDNGGKDAIGKSGVPNDFPGKFPSPYTPKAKVNENLEPVRRTALIETLEAARDGKPKKPRSIRSAGSAAAATSSLGFERIPTSVTSSSTELQGSDVVLFKDNKGNTITHSSTVEDFDGDMTLDLNEPHSQSGRYWKSEYDRYHEEAKLAMEKLVKYKQLAKSYAKRKDSEAIDLGGKLKEEQQKVANMEAKISELATQIANRRLSGRANVNRDLMKDLARQTALAREYGNRVDEFQIALQESHTQLDLQSNRKGQKYSSASTAQIPSETGLEPSREREQLAEMSSLRDEIHNLRLNLSVAEKRASRLQDENAKLSRDLTKVNEELDKSERRRQFAETQNHERHILLQRIQKDYDTLKELAKSQRRDAEDLLKKRHTQVAKLKKEIRLLKEGAAGSIPKAANQVASHAPGGIVTYMKEEVAEGGMPKRIAHVEDLMSFETPPKLQGHSIRSSGKVDDDRSHQRTRETAGALLPLSPLGRSTEKSGIVQQDDARKTAENVPRRTNTISKYNPLSEIINNAQLDNSPARNRSLPASQLSASFQERFSSFSLNSPGPALPSPEPPFTLAPSRIHDRRGTDSPRPSMFNIPSSPPKQMLPRPRSSGMNSHIGRSGNAPSSRVSSMSSRARTVLSSDRAAAAKARLGQKSAEKKRARSMAEEKENVRL
jgi:hypothetical protein